MTFLKKALEASEGQVAPVVYQGSKCRVLFWESEEGS